MKLQKLFIAALFPLQACNLSTEQLPVIYPANLTSPCDTLTAFTGNDLGDLVQYTAYIGQTYRQCAIKHKALGDLLNAPIKPN